MQLYPDSIWDSPSEEWSRIAVERGHNDLLLQLAMTSAYDRDPAGCIAKAAAKVDDAAKLAMLMALTEYLEPLGQSSGLRK